MKGKRLLILGAAFALGLSACASSATMVRKTPLRAAVNGEITFANEGLSNGVQYTDPFDGGDYTVTFGGGGNDGKYYTTGSGIRTYGGGTITVASKSSLKLETISFTWNGDYAPSSSSICDSGTYATGTSTWTGSAESVIFTRPSGSGHWRLQKIKATLESGSTPSTDPTGISIDKTSVIIGNGGDYQLTATLSPNGAVGDIEWESSNDSVVEVDDDGTITGVSVGEATITASVTGTNFSATCDVEVVNYGTEANPLSVDEAKTVLAKTGSALTNHPLWVKGKVSSNKAFNTQYNNYDDVYLKDGNGTDDAFNLHYVKVSVSDPSDALPSNYQEANSLKGYEVTVYGFGTIYKGSTYELTTKSGGNPANPTIKHLAAPSSLIINKSELLLEVDDVEQLVLTLPDGVDESDITWASDDEDIAEVDQSGNVTAIDAGTATISASADGFDAVECNVTVIDKQAYGSLANPISVAQAKAILDNYNGQETRYSLYVAGTVVSNTAFNTTNNYNNFENVYLEDGFDLFRVKFDEESATLLDSYKAVDGMKGYHVIACGHGKIHNGTYELAPSSEVANPLIKSITLPDATDISLDASTAEVEVGQNITLLATLTPANSSSEISWTSSDETVATVEDGVVSGVAVGTATITARVNENIYAECEVTVVAASTLIYSVYKEAKFGPSYNEKNVGDYLTSWYATYQGFRVDLENANNNNNSWNGFIKFGRKNYASEGAISTHEAIDKAIAKIGIVFDSIVASSVNSIALKVSSDGSTWSNAGTFAAEAGEQFVKLNSPSANLYYRIELDLKSYSANGFVQVSGVNYYIAEDPNALTPDHYVNEGSSFATIHGSENSSLESKTYNVSFGKMGFANGSALNTNIGPVVFTADAATNPNETAPQYNASNHEARFYTQNTFTFTSEEPITSIKFTYSKGSSESLSVSDGSLDSENGWAGNNTSVTFTIDATGSGYLFAITAVEVTCGTSLSVGSAALRFGARISQADWAALNNVEEDWEIEKYGVLLAKKTTMDTYHPEETIAQAYKAGERRFTPIESSNGNAPYADGDDYVFTVKLNISQSHDIEYVAAPFIVVSGEYYFFDEMTYSVNTLAAKCLQQGNYQYLSNAALSILAND